MPDTLVNPAAAFSPKDPTRRAVELFEPELAAEVIGQMKEQRLREAPAVPESLGVEQTESIATLWFADRFYDSLGTGRIEGLPIVTWNGPDSFIFRQNPGHPFRYTTAAGRVITPGLMETDGGSVPRLLRGLVKFSSWGYAPAFIVHDWIFVAKKCQTAPDNDFTLDDAGMVMAEIMKTLMEAGYTTYDQGVTKLEKAEDTLYVQYQAVVSILAKRAWDDMGSVRCLREAIA